MTNTRRIIVAMMASGVLAASAAAPSHAVTTVPDPALGHTNDIDPCWLLGPFLGDHC